MKLLTKELEKQFEKYPLYSQEDKGGDATAIAKFFNPCGAGTWLITEASKEGDDYLMFGYCHLGNNETAELGYVSLNELQSIKITQFNLGIERDLYFPKDITLREACQMEFNYVPEFLEEKSNPGQEVEADEPDICDD